MCTTQSLFGSTGVLYYDRQIGARFYRIGHIYIGKGFSDGCAWFAIAGSGNRQDFKLIPTIAQRHTAQRLIQPRKRDRSACAGALRRAWPDGILPQRPRIILITRPDFIAVDRHIGCGIGRPGKLKAIGHSVGWFDDRRPDGNGDGDRVVENGGDRLVIIRPPFRVVHIIDSMDAELIGLIRLRACDEAGGFGGVFDQRFPRAISGTDLHIVVLNASQVIGAAPGDREGGGNGEDDTDA